MQFGMIVLQEQSQSTDNWNASEHSECTSIASAGPYAAASASGSLSKVRS